MPSQTAHCKAHEFESMPRFEGIETVEVHKIGIGQIISSKACPDSRGLRPITGLDTAKHKVVRKHAPIRGD